MSPFNVLVENVADPDLGPLLSSLAHAGYPNPVITAAGSEEGPGRAARDTPNERSAAGSDVADLPESWELVRSLDEQSYRWPELNESYHRYGVYSGQTKSNGTVKIALGWAGREQTWGRDRSYVISFLTAGTPQTPLCEFLETDDFAESRDMLAIVRGSDGGRRMYNPGDSLPKSYDGFRVEVYRDRVDYKGAWNKLAVIAREDDVDTILNHALLQARRRGDL